MNIIHGLILGIVEGLTEFLPISSTAHMVIVAEWLRLPATDFLKTFEISIQVGAILAVVIIFWKKIWSSWELIGKIAAAFIPTAIIGLILYKIIKNYLLDNILVIALALLIGGILLIVLEKYFSRVKNLSPSVEVEINKAISYKQAALIGTCQSLAVIPGVSRAAATIMGGLGLGVSRKNIVEFSFLLAIPTMIAATGLDLFKSRASILALTPYEFAIWLVGFIAAFVTAIIGISFFMKFIKKNNFIPFGWYRIGLGLIVLLWLYLK